MFDKETTEILSLWMRSCIASEKEHERKSEEERKTKKFGGLNHSSQAFSLKTVRETAIRKIKAVNRATRSMKEQILEHAAKQE